jgi:Cu/Ag efflux pump CusA
MATAVIGGLVTSTFLSLLVIPAVFAFVDDAKKAPQSVWRWVMGKLKR